MRATQLIRSFQPVSISVWDSRESVSFQRVGLNMLTAHDVLCTLAYREQAPTECEQQQMRCLKMHQTSALSSGIVSFREVAIKYRVSRRSDHKSLLLLVEERSLTRNLFSLPSTTGCCCVGCSCLMVLIISQQNCLRMNFILFFSFFAFFIFYFRKS